MTPEERKAYFRNYYSKNKYRYRISIHKYRNTEKGKITCKKVNDRFKAKNPKYMSLYWKKKRQQARDNGTCIRCFKQAVAPNRSQCEHCLIISREENWRRRHD